MCVCVCVCVCACTRARVHACVRVSEREGGSLHCMNEIVSSLNLNFIY